MSIFKSNALKSKTRVELKILVLVKLQYDVGKIHMTSNF